MRIATRVLSSSSEANRSPVRPLILVFSRACTTARKMSGVASAPSKSQHNGTERLKNARSRSHEFADDDAEQKGNEDTHKKRCPLIQAENAGCRMRSAGVGG